MKILWASNAPWTATGYGQQSRLFLPYLRKEHDVAIAQNHGHAGELFEWEGLTVYPEGYDSYGNDVIATWASHHMRPDEGWIFALYDSWVYRNPVFRNWHFATWSPVDHQPVPPMVIEAIRSLELTPIAMSKFGQAQFQDADLDAFYVPHAVDPGFAPRDKTAARERYGIPDDAFVVGMNAANKASGDFHRKGYGEAVHAFALFAKHHPDAVLRIHAEATGAQGWDLERLAAGYGLAGRVFFTNQLDYRVGLTVEAMADFYSALDVYLSPSYGEGFGIPIIEAQACGVPVVVTDFTAMPELVGDGWVVPGQLVWHERMQAFWKIPNVGEIVDALGEAYGRAGPSPKAYESTRRFLPHRVWDDHFKPVVDQLEDRIT